MDNLQGLKLVLGGKNENSPNLCELFCTLPKIATLNVLSLRFVDNHALSNENLLVLGEHLIKLKSLQKFYLTLDNCETLGNPGLIGLAENLRFCTNLTVFEFHILNCVSVGGDGLEAMSIALEDLKNLENLQVSLAGHDILPIIVRGIIHLQKLGKLKLNYNYFNIDPS
jgi:hypothetical protein